MPSESNETRATRVQATTAIYPPPNLPEPLPCPRCNSTNTKFCYYNNYNLAQPRHFCKSCRRYWTQGGTLRDIPVGGGTRRGSSTSTTTSSKRPRLVAVESEVMNLGNAASETSQTKESSVISEYGSFVSLLDEQSNGGFLALGNGNVTGGVHYGFEEMSIGYLGESTGEIPVMDSGDTWQIGETECIWPIL